MESLFISPTTNPTYWVWYVIYEKTIFGSKMPICIQHKPIQKQKYPFAALVCTGLSTLSQLNKTNYHAHCLEWLLYEFKNTLIFFLYLCYDWAARIEFSYGHWKSNKKTMKSWEIRCQMTAEKYKSIKIYDPAMGLAT